MHYMTRLGIDRCGRPHRSSSMQSIRSSREELDGVPCLSGSRGAEGVKPLELCLILTCLIGISWRMDFIS